MNPQLLLGVIFAIAGCVLLFRASSLSVRYNAWTTRFRERNPNFNPPPTPEWRARNTTIMTILFRFVGIVLLFRAVTALLAVLG